MRILHVAGKVDPRLGGVATAIRTIIRGTDAMGIHSELVTLDAPDAPFLSGESLNIHTPGKGKGAWYYSNALTPWLRANLDRFDAVVVHGCWQFHGFAVTRVIRQMKTRRQGSMPKVFVMPHGMLDPYFQAEPGRRLKAIRNRYYWKIIEQQNVNNADGVLFTCAEERRLAGHSFTPYQPRYEAVSGLGVEQPPPFHDGMQQAFHTRCSTVVENGYFLFLGRIDAKKGVDLLVNAYCALANERLAAGAPLPKLVIAGPGIELPFGEKIKHQVTLAGLLNSQVVFPGMLQGAAKWGAFYGAGAFVLPSHQENFGIALVEAMACRKPVLISDKVNIWQEVSKAGAGLVNEDSVSGTTQLLQEWLKLGPYQECQMGDQAASCFENNFSVERSARQFMNAISCTVQYPFSPSLVTN